MKRQIVSYLIERNILVQPELLKKLEDPLTLQKAAQQVEKKESVQAVLETLNSEPRKKEQEIGEENKVKILFDYEKEPIKKEAAHFVKYYNNRYKLYEKILLPRLENNISISRLQNKTDKEKASIMGMVVDKHITKTNKIILTLEDQTGSIKALFNTKDQESYKAAKDVVFDEVIGITGTAMKEIIFAEKIILPDIPLQTEIKKSPDEKYAIFISDIHLGSKLFLEKQFSNFINWLKGEYGTEEQKQIAAKTGYCFIAGDLVAGVGIYPRQEEELEIKDIYKQYDLFTHYIKQIPEKIKIIIIPGNHDAGRLAEPQLKINKEFIEELYSKPNIFLLSNPSLVNINSSNTFSGFNVLLYHGYSYDYYSDNVESIRMSGRGVSDRTELISKFLLQRRHLAPTHQSTLSMPDIETDPLFISIVPDFFATGHIHKSAISTYRGTTIICGSSWETQTSFQEKFGHIPDLCKVIAINLKTRKPIILDFETENA